jgi:polyhydroxybutyrate depolymerase
MNQPLVFMVLLSVLIFTRIIFLVTQTSSSMAECDINTLMQAHSQSGKVEYRRRLTVNGLERSHVIHIPRDLDLSIPVPVILAFHGGYGTPESFAQNTGLYERGGRAGFVVVFPEGYKRSWNAGDCCGPAHKQNIDDVAFINALLDDLATLLTIDSRRIYATGFSNGGKFTYRLGCELSDRIAAIAVVGASLGLDICKPKRHMPLLHIHGMADRHAPFQGGDSARRQSGEHRGIPQTLDLWLGRDGCKAEKRITLQRGAVTCTTYPPCGQHAEVILCTIQGMGHQWPGGKVVLPSRLGAGNTDISATDMIIEFFRSHPLPQ